MKNCRSRQCTNPIPDSTSTLSPLQIAIWCTFPAKKSILCSAISRTARSDLGAEREIDVGWKGQVGGPAGTARGASAKRAWAAPPSHNPTLPTTPFPTHNTWSTLGESQLDKSRAWATASGGGGGGLGSRCGVLGWWWRCLASGVHKLKRAPYSPSLESGRAGIPWWRLVATISSMSPLCS